MNNKEKLTEATVQALQNKLNKNNTGKICKIQESENTSITQISSEIISKLEDEIQLTYGWEYNKDGMYINGTLDDDYEIYISILQNNNKITYEYNGNVYDNQDDCIKVVLEDCKNYIRNVLKEYDEYPNYVDYFSGEDEGWDDEEDIEVERTIEIDDEDDSECPYLIGYSSTDLDIEDRGDLTEDELFVTGWTGVVHNVEEGPFESFNEMQIDCYDDEKGGEYDLPDIPEDIQKEFLQRVNNWIKENN